MKKRFVLVLSFIFLFTGVGQLVCLEWTAWGLKSAGKEVVSSGNTVYRLTDALGSRINLEADREPDETVLRKVGETVKVLTGWAALKLREIRFYYIKGKFRAIVLPESFVCEGVEVTPFLPAGIMFFYEERLVYDFRMVKETVSMKVSGIFSTRAEFLLTVAHAVKNPLAFASKSNYMARIDELERRLNRLIYQHHNLQGQFARATRALLYFRNTGFLRGPRDIRPAVVKRVIRLKSDRPKMTLDQIANQLEKEKIKASSKEIHLILSVYFNDFKD